MALSRQSIEILLDLIEIKVSMLQVQDRDDTRELNKLRKCRQELLSEKNPEGIKQRKEFLNPTLLREKTYQKNSYSHS